ncbi:hypothetical protein ABT314_12520 [Streptomyces spiralis]
MSPRRTRRGPSCSNVVLVATSGVGVPLAVLTELVEHAPALGFPLLLAALAAGAAST